MLYLPHLATPESTDYMIAGYVVIFGVMLVYLIGLYLRRRKIEQDLKVLEELEEQTDKL